MAALYDMLVSLTAALPRVQPAGIAVLAALLLGSAPARAQDAPQPFQIKLSGYVNATGGGSVTQGAHASPLIEAEIEATPQYKLPSGTVLALRAAINVQGPSPTSQLAIPEISAFAIGSFGRIEIGARAGFPQSLVGFTPSEIAFTAAEFGPEAGTRLDPDGRLPTAQLRTELASAINRLTYLGYAARFYDDRSPKIIYLTPRSRGGLYAAFSYAPRTIRPSGFRLAGSGAAPIPNRYRDLIQAAAAWTRRSEVVDLTLGATWSHAIADGPSLVPRATRSDSISAGVTATFKDSLTLGLSATYDGFSTRRSDDRTRRVPFGVIGGVNYVSGPWVIGGYYQHASAASDRAPFIWDRVNISEVGMSYLADKNHDLLGAGAYTDVKLFASAYRFGLRRAEQSGLVSNQNAVVFLGGIRFSFF